MGFKKPLTRAELAPLVRAECLTEYEALTGEPWTDARAQLVKRDATIEEPMPSLSNASYAALDALRDALRNLPNRAALAWAQERSLDTHVRALEIDLYAYRYRVEARDLCTATIETFDNDETFAGGSAKLLRKDGRPTDRILAVMALLVATTPDAKGTVDDRLIAWAMHPDARTDERKVITYGAKIVKQRRKAHGIDEPMHARRERAARKLEKLRETLAPIAKTIPRLRKE